MKKFYIYGGIDEYTATDFATFLEENEDVELHINSAGGDIFSAIAISNLVRERGVVVVVDGIAASAATLICCGGKVTAQANSMFMIHSPLVVLTDLYNAESLSKIQAGLTAVTEAVLRTYLSKIKMTEDELKAAMTAETWLTATQAREVGLVDEIGTAAVEMKKAGDVFYVNKIPFTNIKDLPAEVSRNILAEKLIASAVVAERGRVAELRALINDSPARNSIINKAIETGKTAAEIKPYLEALPYDKPRQNLEELFKMLKDNLESGAAGVQGSTGKAEPQEEMTTFSENVAKYANEMLKGGLK